MQNIFIPYEYSIASPGDPWDWTDVLWLKPVQTESLLCNDILNWLQDEHSWIDFFPVACDFSTLSYSWTVFFQNSNDLSFDYSVEIYNLQPPTLTKENVDFIFSVEVGFIVCLIGLWTIARSFRKISPLLFK